GPRPAAPRGSRARDPNGRSELHEGGAPAAPRPAPVRAAGRVVRRRAGQRAGRAARGARREVGMSRGRVGVLVPPANPSAEPELTRLLGSRADMHVSRFPVRPGLALAERLEGYNAALPAMARSFGDLALDALIMACDGPRYLLDPDEDLDECERMSERFGVPFATATVAVMEAIEHLGVDEVHIVSPFQPWLTELAERFWKAAGMRIAGVLPVRAQGGFSPYDITPAELADQVKQANLPRDAVILFASSG